MGPSGEHPTFGPSVSTTHPFGDSDLWVEQRGCLRPFGTYKGAEIQAEAMRNSRQPWQGHDDLEEACCWTLWPATDNVPGWAPGPGH